MADEQGSEKKFATQTAAALELSGYLLNRIHEEMHDIEQQQRRNVDRLEQATLSLSQLEGRVANLERGEKRDDTEAQRRWDQLWDLVKLVLAALAGALAVRFLR